jgi:hypothetical protein
MASVITYPGGEFEPDLILGVEWSRRSTSIAHELVDGSGVVVTVRPASTRSGKLSMFFLTEHAAHNADKILALADVFAIATTDHPGRDMRFVVDGNITTTLDPDTVTRWIVTADYREV